MTSTSSVAKDQKAFNARRFTQTIAFLSAFDANSVHAIVTDAPDRLIHHTDTFARILRPGAHIFCPQAATGIQGFRACVERGIDFRGSIIRVQSTPTKRVRKSDDIVHYAEIFHLYRKVFAEHTGHTTGAPGSRTCIATVAQCLRIYQTGGLRRIGPGQPFSDVIREDDHDVFMAKIRRAALPLGVGVLIDPFHCITWRAVDGEISIQEASDS